MSGRAQSLIESKRICRQAIVLAGVWVLCCCTAMIAGLMSPLTFIGAAMGLVTAIYLWFRNIGGKDYLWRLRKEVHIVDLGQRETPISDFLEIQLWITSRWDPKEYVIHPDFVYEFKHAKHAMALKMKWGTM